MTNKLITPATVLPVSMVDARLALRVDDSSLDTLIDAWVRGITDYAEHILGRSIMAQTWLLTLDSFPDAVQLRNVPIMSVATVKYLDIAGVQQTLSPLDYFVDFGDQAAYIVPAFLKAWPTTYEQINSVEVTYTCGYGSVDTATPPAIKSYILAKLVEQFDASNKTDKASVQSSFLDRLLDRYKVWS